MQLLERDDTGGIRLTEDLPNNKILPYAILSHTWGDEEVLFRDLRDGLRFFWVDTCCIDMSNSVELQEAINSMFCWYRNATRCYTYLADPAFRASRWFTHGWTLQELIAPTSFEFFSREEVRLVDRTILEQAIHDILRRAPLSDFSLDGRMAWIEKRTKTREEEMAYSLFGIFDV
ncbi:HET domain containing protein [Rhypophila sp. PSN 637]